MRIFIAVVQGLICLGHVQGLHSFNLVSDGLLWKEDCCHLAFLGGFSFINSIKILLCVSLGSEPPQVCTNCFLTVSPLSLHPLPSVISNCLNLPFGAQGRSWRLESVAYKQETGTTGRLLYSGDPQALLGFAPTRLLQKQPPVFRSPNVRRKQIRESPHVRGCVSHPLKSTCGSLGFM